MTREEQLACLIDRPCNACKFHDKGCFRWKCVFEEEPTDVKPLYKIDTDGHIEEVNKIKEFYNKGYKDGQEALAFHLELCKEEAEPCEDAISRKAVMDYIKDCTIDLGYENGTYMVLDAISKLPSVQPPMGKWIPVSEMLPSDCNEDWVLAQIIEPDTGYLWIPCVAEYRKGLDDWYTDSCGLEWVRLFLCRVRSSFTRLSQVGWTSSARMGSLCFLNMAFLLSYSSSRQTA